jgi:small-conductance mechanosensitive channel
MWEWFMANGVWILVAVATGVVLFLLLRRWTPWIVAKLVPEQLKEPNKKLEKTVSLAIAFVGGIILVLGITAFAVAFYGVDLGPTWKAIVDWLLSDGIRIFAIILVAWFIYKILGIIMPLFVMRYVVEKGKKRRSKGYLKQRSQTLGRVVTQAIGIFIVLIVAFMILSELGMDITPLLASAGVVGIVIGLAAQDSVRNYIGGFVIMLEDHYNVGDVIKVADITGEVEELGLRRTVLRDLRGILHIVPNGEIKVASNYTRSISRAFFEVSVAYKEDLDRVMSVIRKTWEGMAKDPEWEGRLISETPWLLRVEEFGDSGIVIRAVGDTKPMEQWNVMGELRRRIKRAFDEQDIEIPWPHVKLYMGDKPADEGLICPACSGPNPPGSKLCAHCGAKLAPKPTPPKVERDTDSTPKFDEV